MKDPADMSEERPVPVDDGACDHLPGMRLPSVPLPGTSGRTVDPQSLAGDVVIYFYPMMADPHAGPPTGWSDIAGAKGCTPQSCAFRDDYGELRALGVDVYGISTQSPEGQREAMERLGLPFELLSDSDLVLARALDLPTFEHEGAIYIRRITLIVRDGVIERVFYPVFPPESNAAEVIAWLRNHPAGTRAS